jgi:hypothetical protein
MEFSGMRLLMCLMVAGGEIPGAVLFNHTREDLVIENTLMGHPGNPQIILAHRLGSQDEWQAWTYAHVKYIAEQLDGGSQVESEVPPREPCGEI